MMNDRVFNLNRNFTKKLHKRLLAFELNLQGSFFIPSIEQLEEIILAVFWASMQPEEGRLSRLRVAFREPLTVDNFAVVFAVPKRLNIEELRKLAPAINPNDGHIGVWPYGENKELYIWGLQTTSLVEITFEVIDPGRVTISLPINSKVAEITGQKAGFISPTWMNNALNIMSHLQINVNRTPTSILLSQLSIQVTREILRRIRLMGHGGTIIFISDTNRWLRSVAQPIFYACKQHLNMVRPIIYNLKTELQKVEDDKVLDNIDKLKSAFALLNGYANKVFIENAATSIANLTTIDGAIILDSNFEVLAFGAKLKQSRTSKRTGKSEMVTRFLPIESQSISDNVALDQEFRGTRHMSAAQFVQQNPGSVAFVVSQDGGITIMIIESVNKKDDSTPKVLVYRGVELLL